jgi:hypothetical protein
MIMNDIREIDNLTRLTRKREFDDGLVDILYGGVFLVWGLASWFLYSTVGLRWLVTALTQQREITIIAMLALAPVFLLVIYGMRRLIEWIRRRYLWKDSGYVEALKWQVSRSITIIATCLSIALILGATWQMARGALSEEGALGALVASANLGTAVVYLGMGIDLRIRRYLVVGIAGLILTVILLSQMVSFAVSWLLLGVGWMIILTVSGLWALLQSIRSLAESAGD